ncbi:uncharacterized protein prr14 isoform X1 [Pungitius pungitius]|uniref:uncharacterized protein prr14 isoform X1 n=2 Tax=Pungitius pungitius TaxID=134920 RepID=UPI002E12DA98
MLTYPSDSLHQIVCPMDEHDISPNNFCSEPPPPLLPLSSVTPSCAKNGISGSRESCCVQELRAPPPKKQSSRAAQKPHRHNPAPSKRQRESADMVSQAKQQRVEGTQAHDTPEEEGFDGRFEAECRTKQSDQRDLETEVNVVEHCMVDGTQPLDTMASDMDACGHSLANASPPKGWVIGPLFQSFRSKMASFTEIVMTPVKLFRANSPPPFTDLPDKLDELDLEAAGASDVEPSDVCPPGAQSEGRNPERLGEVQADRGATTVALLYPKKLLFDEELPAQGFEQVSESAATQKEKNSPDPVPLKRLLPSSVPEGGSVSTSVLLQPSLNISASHEAKLNVSGAVEEQTGRLTVQLKPLPKKCTVKKVPSKTSTYKVKKQKSEVSDEQVTLMDSVQINKVDSSCSAQPDVCDGSKMEVMDRPGNLRNLTDLANGGTMKPSLDTPQPDCALNPKSDSASGLGRERRGLQLDCHSQDLVKKRRCTKDTRRQQLLTVASVVGPLRPQRREVVSTTPVVHQEEKPKPVEKRPVSTRANKKGRNGQERLTINEAVLITQTERYSLDESSSVSENNLKVSSSQEAPSGPSAKTTTSPSKPHADIDSRMELETSMAAASTKQTEQERLSEAPPRRNINKRPVKRKSQGQFSSTAQSGGTLFSASSAPPADLNVQKEESSEKGLTVQDHPSKRTQRDLRVAASGGSQEAKQCIHDLHPIAKENQPDKRRGKVSMHPVYFEMTPLESNAPPVPSSSQPRSKSSVQSNNAAKHSTDEEKSAASVSDELFPSDSSVSVSGSAARGVNVKPRRANKKKRCQVLHGGPCKGGEVTNAAAVDNDAAPAAASSHSEGKDLSRRLLRSYSCPEIPSLRLHDTPTPWALHSPRHARLHSAPQHQASHAHHAHKSRRRARRHTVCSVEVEREIAPLCLRKEVYPSRRSLPSATATQPPGWAPSLSPSTSLAALASCFLSSPLAFLSKKVGSGGAAASPGTPVHASSSSASCSPVVRLFRMDSSPSAALDYSSSGNPTECEMERRQRSEEEEDDGEDTSSSSQEFEDVGLRDEKALSDSEIKVGQKHEERGKVSSIKIRKTLPKPQNNLTPMGLPRAVRLKKKEFSLEEIYTNKNFSKPPESRLETIFEVPLSRRDGSESWYGQRRVKRFLEFLDAGEVRKPKKPLVGVGKAGVSSSRTRRGGFPKDDACLSARDVDSLLCAKLDQLTLLLIGDQKGS